VSSFFYRNSLSIVLFSVFALTVIGQALVGWKALEHELAIDGLPPLSLPDYLGTGHFRSALFENWESEFLQLSAYVLLTIFLRQKGSPESKDLEGKAERAADPRGASRYARAGAYSKRRIVCCSSSPSSCIFWQDATCKRGGRAQRSAAHHHIGKLD
jgi:hypothetical protein